VKSTLKRRPKELEIVKREAYEAIDRGREPHLTVPFLAFDSRAVTGGRERTRVADGWGAATDRVPAGDRRVSEKVRFEVFCRRRSRCRWNLNKFRAYRGCVVPRKRRKRPGGRTEDEGPCVPEGSFVREIGGRSCRVRVRRLKPSSASRRRNGFVRPVL